MRDVNIETHLHDRSGDYTRKPRRKISSNKYDLKKSGLIKRNQGRLKKKRSVCLKTQQCNTQRLYGLSHASESAPLHMTLKPAYQVHPHNQKSPLISTQSYDLADLTFTDMEFLSKSSRKTRDNDQLQSNLYQTNGDIEYLQRPLSGTQVQFSSFDRQSPSVEGHDSVSHRSQHRYTNFCENWRGAQASTSHSRRSFDGKYSGSKHASSMALGIQRVEMSLPQNGKSTDENATPSLSAHNLRVGEPSQQTQSWFDPLMIEGMLRRQPKISAEQIDTDNFFDDITKKALIGKEPGFWRLDYPCTLPGTTSALNDLQFLAKRSEPRRDLSDPAFSTSKDDRKEQEVAFFHSPGYCKLFTTHHDWACGMPVDPLQSLYQSATPEIPNNTDQHHQPRSFRDDPYTASICTGVSDHYTRKNYSRSVASGQESPATRTTNKKFSSIASDISKWISPNIQADWNSQDRFLQSLALVQPMEAATSTDSKRAPKIFNHLQHIPRVSSDDLLEDRKHDRASPVSSISRANVGHKRCRVDAPLTTEPRRIQPWGTVATQLQKSNLLFNFKKYAHPPETKHELPFGNKHRQQRSKQTMWLTTKHDTDQDLCFPRFRGFNSP